MLRPSLAILGLMCLNACAFTQLNVTPPKESFDAGVTGGKGRRLAVVIPMEDSRTIRHRCGMQKNGYNMDTANIMCTAEPVQWLPELLATELGKAGFQVEKTPTPGTNSLIVQGQLLHFFLEPKVGFWTFTPEADIHVKLIVKNEAGLLAERSFYTKAEEVSMVGTENNVQRASDAAVKAIVKNMVVAITELTEKYPN